MGDLTFEVGFVLAALLYLVLYLATKPVSEAEIEWEAAGEPTRELAAD